MKRHPTDLLSLLAGLLFAGLGALFALDRLDRIDLDARWIPAVVLLGLGLAMLLGAFSRPAADTEPATAAAPVTPATPVDSADSADSATSPVDDEPATVEPDVVS